MIRIFERPTNKEWKELILIDDEKDLIKIYKQNKKLGFPFSEYKTSLKEYGYKSADEFYKAVTKRERNNLGYIKIQELEVSEQIASEIAGLINLVKYRNDNKFQYNDVMEKLKEYVSEDEAMKLVNLQLKHNIERHSIQVILEGDNSFTTWINGTIEEIKRYYIGQKWDTGNVDTEDFRVCNKVEFIY